MEYRALRNKLTHEYPSNEDEVIEGIYIAVIIFDEMEDILVSITRYIDNHSL